MENAGRGRRGSDIPKADEKGGIRQRCAGVSSGGKDSKTIGGDRGEGEE